MSDKDLLDKARRSEVDPPSGVVGILPSVWPRVDSGLQITGGGAIAVDTETLRSTAARFATAEAELGAICQRLGALQNMLFVVRDGARDASASAHLLSARLTEVRHEGDRIALALREAAIAYELVELSAEYHAALAAGDAVRASALDAQVRGLIDEHPEAWSTALEARLDHTVLWPSELVRQSTESGVSLGGHAGDRGAIWGGASAGLLTLGAAAAVGISGSGRLSRDARLSGEPGRVSLTPVTPVAAPGAPRTLTAVTERMPGAGDSRVRVEKYAMPDGTRQFAVYVAGTQSMALGGADPWDNRSNAELYTGRMSASYAATEQALTVAGARPGDVVHAFGHSQGAMIAAHLALESEYDTRTLVSFGSPVEADVGDRTLSVSLRHSDDPVAALAGGGHIEGVGAPGSFVAERVVDPDSGIGDLAVPAHRMMQYAETAALVDASGDPRVGALQDVLAELRQAESVEVTEYAATRD